MKIVVLTLVLCLFSGAGIAKECKAISKATDRLACYDKATPPEIAEKQKAEPTKKPSAAQGQYIDKLAVENAHLNKKISNICRGC